MIWAPPIVALRSSVAPRGSRVASRRSRSTPPIVVMTVADLRFAAVLWNFLPPKTAATWMSSLSSSPRFSLFEMSRPTAATTIWIPATTRAMRKILYFMVMLPLEIQQ